MAIFRMTASGPVEKLVRFVITVPRGEPEKLRALLKVLYEQDFDDCTWDKRQPRWLMEIRDSAK